MDGGATTVLRRELWRGEYANVILRLTVLTGLAVGFRMAFPVLAVTDWRSLAVAAVVVTGVAWSVAVVILVSRRRFVPLLAHLTVSWDLLSVVFFFLLFTHSRRGGTAELFGRASGLALVLILGGSVLRLSPANSALAALVALAASLISVLALGSGMGWGSSYPAFGLLPAAVFLAGMLSWLAALFARRALEANLVNEDLERASRRWRMTMDIVQASVFNLSELVKNLQRISVDLSEGARNQAVSIDRISAAVAALNKSQEEISDSTEISAKTIRRTVDSSDAGNQVVKRVIDEVKGISDAVDRMVSFTELIDEIADNTNLLALNANIEASRAGDDTEGFSVVATEIRRLAEQAQQTASEVTRLVKQIAKVIYVAGSSTQNAGEIFDKINSDLSGYAEFVRGLHHSVQEQLKANRDVERSVSRITSVTRENAQAADHVRQVVGELLNEVSKLKALVDGKVVEAAGRSRSVAST